MSAVAADQMQLVHAVVSVRVIEAVVTSNLNETAAHLPSNE